MFSLTTYYLLLTTFISPVLAIDTGDVYGSPFKKLTDTSKLVTVLLSNAYIIAGVVFLFLFIFWGFGTLANSGSTDQQKIAKNKAAITAAFIGFLIIFASYWIIQIVQLTTGVNILGK